MEWAPWEKSSIDASVDELSNYFVQAFPALTKTEERNLPPEESLELAQHCFYVRFIERFCEYFGLVTVENKEKISSQLDYLIRTTPFFDEMFQWK